MPDVIHGVVRDRHGRPLADARISFASGPVPLPDVAALTGPDGTFALTAPAPGSYTILCTLPDGRGDRRTVVVAPGREVTVAFEMATDPSDG